MVPEILRLTQRYGLRQSTRSGKLIDELTTQEHDLPTSKTTTLQEESQTVALEFRQATIEMMIATEIHAKERYQVIRWGEGFEYRSPSI
eukprot:m.96071 g.96071  ORF g.96071 m.96071 type:complete len:89 (-) comp8961_c0_seq1:40-306(-)